MSTPKIVGSTVVVLALLAVIVVGGYQLGWWLRTQEVNRGAEIRRGSFEYQETRRDEIIRQAGTLADIDTQLTNPALTTGQTAALTAQRRAASTQLCNLAGDVIGEVTPAVDSIIREECINA